MKIKHLFYMLLALPLAFAACEETPNDVENPAENNPVLTLTSQDVLNFGAEGGEAEIAYTLQNAVEGTELTATADANWVKAVVGDKVRVTVEANEGEARETKIVVAYGDQNFEVAVKQAAKAAKEYLYDEELAYAERVDLSEYGFPYNYYLIAFYTADGNILMGTVLVGAEGEEILSAGTYTAANGGLMMEGFELYVGETEEYFFEGGDGTIVVGGDIEGYTFDIDIADAEGQNFHFTYEGVVEAMNPNAGLPTEDVTFAAEKLDGIYYGTQYSETYNYYIVLSDLGLDEEGYAFAGGTYYQADLYGLEGTVDEEGYIHVPAGTYVYDADDTMAELTMGDYYSGYYKINADGTAYDAKSGFSAGQAVVTENGITLTVTVGGVQHTVTYEGAPVIYVGDNGGDNVGSEDTELEVEHAFAYYFGDQYTPGYADNYYLFLSDLGLDEEGYEMANGKYYRFDIYAPIAESNVNKIPAGTYTVDMYDSGEPWTASLSYSAYYVLDEYAWDYVDNDYFASGTVVVNEDGSIVAELTLLMSGTTHKVTYNGGDIAIYDMSSGGEGGDGPYSTLTEDLVCNLSDHTLYYQNYGDWYEVGYDNWMVAIMPNSKEGDFVQFDLLVNGDNMYGTYTISDSLGAGTSYVGYIDYDGYFGGSWYYTEDGYSCAPFVDGWVEIIDNQDGTASVEFEVWDDCDFFVEGACTCRVAPVSELQSVTRSSSSLKQIKSIVVNNAAPVAKERVVAKHATKAAAPAKGLKLR